MNQSAATTARPSTRDVHQTITDQIIASIEAGAGAFTMPSHRAVASMMPATYVTGNNYNGVNVIALWVAAERHGFTSGYWATYKQWNRLGCQVRKGDKGNVVVFYKNSEIEFGTPDHPMCSMPSKSTASRRLIPMLTD